MYSHNNIAEEYDFVEENSGKWKGLFTPALKKVLEQVHSGLSAKDDALLYMENLCLKLLTILCGNPPPHTIQDIEERVKRTFPKPLDNWALNDAREAIDKSKKRKLVLPVDRVHTMLQKEVLQYKIDGSVTLFLVAVLEYVSADVLKLAGNYVKNYNHVEISQEDIRAVIDADKVLTDMFCQNDLIPCTLPPTPHVSASYEDVVKELIHDEKQYQRDLHMIIRVFREELVNIVEHPKELDPIFSNIFDIYEVTVTLLGSLEDVIEMAQEQNPAYVGSCFEELAEAAEFDVYIKYARDVTSQESRDALNTLLSKPGGQSLMAAGHGFREAVKYYLPKLLLTPIWHAFLYLDYIKNLMDLSPSSEDRESFEQVQGLLKPLQCELESINKTIPNGFYKDCKLRLHNKTRRQLAIDKIRDLQNTVEHWDRDVGQCCNEFIREDTLTKYSGKRTERKVYLFDGLLVLCKTTRKGFGNQSQFDFTLKERFFMRKVEIIDRADGDELKNAFEIAPRTPPSPVILIAKNAQHKNDWMADLIMVNTKSMLDRILDRILSDIEKRHPLKLPSPKIYQFAIPDSSSNIILEKESAGVPLIKGASLYKLVERLTYHIYADPKFVRTFLITYRYFCSPQQLLQLLIERFNIPDPSIVYQQDQSENIETDRFHKNSQREDWKRYKKEFVQPVQFRVLNVLRHWVDHHFYDFEKDPTLLNDLNEFLETVTGKSMRKWVDSVLKIVQRKKEQEANHKQITFAYGHSPPAIEYHLQVPEHEYNLLTLHPLELARQLTLYVFELFKNIKPSELVGSPHTKDDKEIRAPNVLKSIIFNTNVSRWFGKSIVETENYEERVAILTRAIEVMMVMVELNNFDGIIAISAALVSSSVNRLKLTFEGLALRYKKFHEECQELTENHSQKYLEKLRSINPPCVPFLGPYLTNILLLEQGNPDCLPNTELINFSKRRKVAEIIGEIQQYQNQPYCLAVDPKIRHFLENLDPLQGMSAKDFEDYLFEKSEKIEPRGCKQPLRFVRKWPELNLKSPGIKPRRHNNISNSNSSNSNKVPSVPMHNLSTNNCSSVPNHYQINEGESPPVPVSTASCSTILIHPPQQNTQDFSVFSVVKIGAKSLSNTYSFSHQVDSDLCTDLSPNESKLTAYSNNVSNNSHNSNIPPELPKRSNSITSFTNINNSNDTSHWGQAATSPPISPKLTNSSISNIATVHQKYQYRSPFQNTFHKLNLNQAEKTNLYNFPPNEEVINVTLTSGSSENKYLSSPTHCCDKLVNTEASSMTVHKDHNPVPISPHVNVPVSSHTNVKAPPLPPRKQDRKKLIPDADSFQLAQKRQAPDAPKLPPRDGDLSPPPVPPRLSQNLQNSIGCHSCQPQTHQTHASQPNSPYNAAIFRNYDSSASFGDPIMSHLGLPTSSTLMIRRNSAMERERAAKSSAESPSNNCNINLPPPAQINQNNSPKLSSSISPKSPHSYTQQHSSIIIVNKRSNINISPRVVFGLDGEATNMPKLPPKPKSSSSQSSNISSAHMNNSADKGTMFTYPSASRN